MEEAREVRTTCPYCGVGCGVLAEVAADGTTTVRGDLEHPANFGKLCSKGTALGETLGLEGRLLRPEIGGRQAGWDEALDLVAGKFSRAIAEHGPDSVAFYVSGQLLTEDYYVANKLMKGFIGSANIDTNSRLCMASSVAGHRRAFGEDIVPGVYEDFEQADLVVLTGSNTAWCHPVLYQRMLAARRERGTKIVVIDPRRTATADECDLHLALDPGTDVLLFNGLLAHLAQAGKIDTRFIRDHTSGFDAAAALAGADAPSIARVAKGCGLAAADVQEFYDLFAGTERTVSVYSQGVNQSAHGTDKVNAIINCHLATGRIGKPGMGPFSVTGQPNAMGGREVGGLANQLAAHMDFADEANIDRVSRFWNAPNIARRGGLKAVDMFQAVADGRIKSLWVMGTNPAVSMPDASRVRAALSKCDFVVASDVARTDTTRYADVLLPAAAWGEKDGTVTNSERRLSRQRAFLLPPGKTRADWRIICEVAARMGFGDAFAYQSPADIFREHVALSAFENDGERLFDLGELTGLSDTDYDTFVPRHWPASDRREQQTRLLGDGRFPTPDGRARFVPVRQEATAFTVDADYPLALNTGRLRDQWHTMTRTGNVPRLMANAPEPAVDLHPADAAARHLKDGDLAHLSTRFGFVRARVRVSEAQRRGQAFLPMHWSGHFAAKASAGLLSSPVTDPHSGQPELKHVPVRIVREETGWAGVLITRRDLRPTGFVHWSRHAVEGGWVYELTGTEPPDQGILLARKLLGVQRRDQLLEYTDRRGLAYRAAAIDDGGAMAEALLVAAPDQLPARDWLVSLLAARQKLSTADRHALLSGRSPVPMPAIGRVVCACFHIGANQLASAVAAGCDSLEAIGSTLRAGTNCGSCRSEIRAIIDARQVQAAE
ncbi:nitrate reductase [Mesorhizobium sp. M2D.F.Ca.ET.185.01.1.1]|uniref:nitrate reductase n=2 Tax=Mesorhizobium TaxID=68287 RepID=UPI000FCC726F|nr:MULTISPECIES: nitrate reductase [unclassified Mesorhizobium]TGP83004.1 nitrate reductase [bacterium M00.F.Ca.ET.227.01.1.1]TGP98961.1 nitrate reductase [bacterium M00.F.Ca.ET.221.01.1.1]TGP99691.1 nitrate reductase [bacterium M00.F.Ca.ET.222.01.1.1]TGT96972.1 nitrate reductase [bacterium M00.F.Ca.ET.163.01.1.1]TGU25246.1 nitrate reductase [bacterium M00.F.Ca.ET.156.01.1.1]TGU42561.1 nitrate reductase [bacterium M00.F.Ca.ET.146.01.1.1]TGV71087.1 nitrate reductase [Mesorhizobium sp. M2D.F.C